MQSCACSECVSACYNDPGRLVPGDIARISQHLNISSYELINGYLVKILQSHNNQKVFSLAPAKRKGKRCIIEPCNEAPEWYAQENGRCIFLDDNDCCSIHEVKPFECGAYMGCKNSFLGKPYREKYVEEYFRERWKNNQQLMG